MVGPCSRIRRNQSCLFALRNCRLDEVSYRSNRGTAGSVRHFALGFFGNARKSGATVYVGNVPSHHRARSGGIYPEKRLTLAANRSFGIASARAPKEMQLHGGW